MQLAADDKFPKTENPLNAFKSVGEALERTDAAKEEQNIPIHAVCLDLKEKDMIPSVLSRWTPQDAGLFVTLVERFEAEEEAEFPHLAKERMSCGRHIDYSLPSGKKIVLKR